MTPKTRRQLLGHLLLGSARGAAGGALVGAGIADDNDKDIGRKMLGGAAVGAIGGLGLGAATHKAMRRARRAHMFAWRGRYQGHPTKHPFVSETNFMGKRMTIGAKLRDKVPKGGAEGFNFRQRWDPHHGWGYGKAPAAPGAKVNKALDRIPENIRKRVGDLARMAKDKSSPHEAEIAKNHLEAMAKKHKFNAGDIIKNAAFMAGLRNGMTS